MLHFHKLGSPWTQTGLMGFVNCQATHPLSHSEVCSKFCRSGRAEINAAPSTQSGGETRAFSHYLQSRLEIIPFRLSLVPRPIFSQNLFAKHFMELAGYLPRFCIAVFLIQLQLFVNCRHNSSLANVCRLFAKQ